MSAKITAIYNDEINPPLQVYDYGTDWQVVGHQYERWHSVWEHDKQGSLKNALSQIPNFDPSHIVYLWSKPC